MIKNLFEDRLELKPSTRLNSFSSLSSFLSPDPRPQTDPIGWYPLKVIYFGHFSSLLLASRAQNRPILYSICFNWAKYSFLPSYPPLPSQAKPIPMDALLWKKELSSSGQCPAASEGNLAQTWKLFILTLFHKPIKWKRKPFPAVFSDTLILPGWKLSHHQKSSDQIKMIFFGIAFKPFFTSFQVCNKGLWELLMPLLTHL